MGPDGPLATLRYMKQFVHDAIVDPSQRLRTFALGKIRGFAPYDKRGEMTALHAFVRDSIRYVADPVGYETVATPIKTLEFGQGDCDDKATLLAALLKVVGIPARFVAVGLNGGPLSHVLVEAQIKGVWIPLETIINRPAGWFPNGVTSAYRMDV